MDFAPMSKLVGILKDREIEKIKIEKEEKPS